jgi:adenylate cyclase
MAKIIGDALHVLFGALGDQPDYATRDVDCASALDVFAEAFRKRWRDKGVEVGATRIGVHAGPAIVGNFGGSRLFDYTAYGDTINTAARLEAAKKQLGTRMCVSAAVARRAERFRGRPIGDLLLRGRTEALRTFEPLVPEEDETSTTSMYLDAFSKLEANESGAMSAFAALVGMREDDCLASFHLKRLLNGERGTAIKLS